MGKSSKTKRPKDGETVLDETVAAKQTEKRKTTPASGTKVQKAAKAVNDAVPGTEGNQEKGLKRKKIKETEVPPPEGEDAEVPVKKVKADSRIITAGTTIDQLVGIKLKKKLGKRAKKRENHATNIEAQKEKTKVLEQTMVKEYLEGWKHNREKWKFQKLKQIFIQKHIFDEAEIDADTWPLALEYLSGTRGGSKDILLKTAETIIQEIDTAATTKEDDTLQESCKYQRARELLQSLG